MHHLQALVLVTAVAVYGCDWWSCPTPSGDDYQQQQTQERIRRLEEQEQQRQFNEWLDQPSSSRYGN